MAVGRCVTYAAEGEECDFEWTFNTPGRPCDAGLSCLVDPRDPTRQACFRGCEDAATDCPCNGDPDVLDTCVENVPELVMGERGICAQCLANREAYTPGSWDCCDPASDTASGTCCHPEGAACASDAECCLGPSPDAPNAICNAGRCQECTPSGERFQKPGCCSGDPPVDGFCPNVCEFNGEDVVEGEECCGGGTWRCDQSGASCDGAPDEVADCSDNDCDGDVDEGFRDASGRVACTAVVPPGPNFDGCPNLGELEGFLDCTTASPICRISEGWCAWDRLRNPLSNGVGECLTGGDVDCTAMGCLWGEWCCQVNAPNPVCMPRGYIQMRGALEPVVNYPPPTECWRPGERNTDLRCPDVTRCIGSESCISCVETSGCGFCDDGRVCLPGDDMGPAGGLRCGASDWYDEGEILMCPRGRLDAGRRDAGM